MNIKRKLIKFYIKLKWKFIDKRREKYFSKLNKIQSLAIDITMKLIRNKNSILLIAPNSNERYLSLSDNPTSIQNTYPETFITLERGRILIINHQYYYNLDIDEKVFSYLLFEFNKETERRRRKMKKDIIDNVESSLTIINKKLD